MMSNVYTSMLIEDCGGYFSRLLTPTPEAREFQRNPTINNIHTP